MSPIMDNRRKRQWNVTLIPIPADGLCFYHAILTNKSSKSNLYPFFKVIHAEYQKLLQTRGVKKNVNREKWILAMELRAMVFQVTENRVRNLLSSNTENKKKKVQLKDILRRMQPSLGSNNSMNLASYLNILSQFRHKISDPQGVGESCYAHSVDIESAAILLDTDIAVFDNGQGPSVYTRNGKQVTLRNKKNGQQDSSNTVYLHLKDMHFSLYPNKDTFYLSVKKSRVINLSSS